MSSIVSVVRCEDYAPEAVDAAVREALRLAHLDAAIPDQSTLLLKPNLLSTRRPDEAVTTHPAVVAAVGRTIATNQTRILIGDSPPFAGTSASKYARLCEVTGMVDAARELGAEIVRFEEDSVEARNPNGRFYRSFEIAAAVAQADAVVNIAKLKTHGLTGMTGAVKNLFGCIPGITKGIFHAQAAEDRETFSQMLVDLLGALTVQAHVIDAVVAMDGEGPNAGRPRQVGLIMASSDPVALDAVACAIVGVEPFSIHTTRLAHEQGLGCGDLEKIEICGESIRSASVSGFTPSSGVNQWEKIPAPLRRTLRRQLTASPQVIVSECTGCGDCARACPIRAIAPGKPPIIDLSECIRCYCCHEVCNNSAISLRRGWLGNALLSRQKR